jgi:hypothetical protein
MSTEGKSHLQVAATTAQVISVVAGVVISVLSFNAAREQEDIAREKEAEARSLEAAQPFLELRQDVYTDAVKQAAILVNPEVHTPEELATAKKRFRALYVAELSMVESREVEAKMVALATVIDPPLARFTSAQQAAYDLSHALRDTFVSSWGVDGK